MAINKVKRQTDPFICDGSQTVFPFDFKVFAPTDIGVLVNPSGSWFTKDTALAYGQDYTVTLNENQETNPGGIATLKKPQSQGTRLVVISQIEPLQTLTITRTGGFYPDALNSAFDRAIALIQELLGISKRALLVPQTSSQKPEDVVQDLMNAQTTAKQFADQAQESYENTKAIEDRLVGQEATILEGIKTEGEKQLGLVQNEGTKQVGLVQAEGDTQAERLNNIFDTSALASGMACSRRCWEVTQNVASGQEITLPNAQKYVVGRNHLMVYLDDLYVDSQHFTEVGEVDTVSSKIKLAFDLKVNESRPHFITTMVIPLGREDATELFERVKVLEDAFAQLSRTVAYVQTTKE